MKWYAENKRDLPWRQTKDPYLIWLSETILQQTRVEQGLPYYFRFAEQYPTVNDLAEADLDSILKLWQGLGYYSRARNMHITAIAIAKEYGGEFPKQYKAIRQMKGVGDYTAAAIMSFAYNETYATVDGNVYRVLSRIFGVDEYIDTSAGKKLFNALANDLLDQEDPGIYNQAIMDFGAMQCIPRSPNCEYCPFSNICIARKADLIKFLPRKKGKVKVSHRYFNYFDIRVGDHVFLKRRGENDIWEGLYDFPLIETSKPSNLEVLMQTEEYKTLFKEQESITIEFAGEIKHILSHQIIHATFYKVDLAKFSFSGYKKMHKNEKEKYGVSRLIDKYLLADLDF